MPSTIRHQRCLKYKSIACVCRGMSYRSYLSNSQGRSAGFNSRAAPNTCSGLNKSVIFRGQPRAGTSYDQADHL